jgi:hypothetical protein
LNDKAELFEIKEMGTFFHKVWQEIYLLLFFNIGLIVGNVSFYSKYYLIIELCLFGLLLYRLFNKRNRHIYKIKFDDNNQILTIFFYQFITFKFNYNIPYKFIKVSYKHKIYGRGKIPITLEFKENKKFIAEIKQKYNIGWTNEEIERIYNRIKRINND